MEELDSDDEEEAPEDDPLAEAGLRVRATIMSASNATVDVHARAQEAMEKYKCDPPHLPAFALDQLVGEPI